MKINTMEPRLKASLYVKFYVDYQYCSRCALTLHVWVAATLHYYHCILDSVPLPT